MIQDHDETQLATAAPEGLTERSSIAAEANFLRLPLFALHTKGLKNLDGFECRGTTTRGDTTQEFLFRTARSTATLYPGPLSRSVHLAFLSLITEQGLPFANPVRWTWRNLCQRLGVQPSGRMVQHLKAAIEATAGLTIYSRDALYSKPEGKRINSRKAAHLYESVVFVNESLPDGSTADANYLWLSPWYLDNLNALFTAPLDHELWRSLDRKSPIASRLYEFLLINFYSGVPQLKINYSRLAQFLPVRPERYLSDARKQLQPAFQLITKAGVVESVLWHKQKTDVAQLRFCRGSRLRSSPETKGTRPASLAESEAFAIREVRRTPEREIVGEFYRLWSGEAHQQPHAADLSLARRLLTGRDLAQIKAILPLAIQQLKQHWPGAKTFVAIERDFHEAATHYQRQQQHVAQRRQQQKTQQAELENAERQRVEREQFEANWQPVWEKLSSAEQATVRDGLLALHPFLRHAPFELQFRCLQELARNLIDERHVAPE